MQHVCNSSTLNYSVQDIVADADQYKSSAGQRAAAPVAIPNGAASSVAAPPQNPILRRMLAGAAAASEAAAAVFGPLSTSGPSSPQADDAPAAAGAAGAVGVGGTVRGLTLPLSAPEQLTPQQQLVLFLRRRLLPLRVAARRIAAAEAWALHVAEQQQKRAQAAAASNAEDDMLLQGLAEDAGEGVEASGKAAAAANGSAAQPAQGNAAGGAAPAANGLPAAAGAGKGEADVQQVLEQRKASIAARAEQLLLQQPLALSDVLASFQVAHFSASQQLNIQVSMLQSVWVGWRALACLSD